MPSNGLVFTVASDLAPSSSPTTDRGTSPATSTTRSLLDAYAPKYIPQWQREANNVINWPAPRIADLSHPRKELNSLAAELYPGSLQQQLLREHGEIGLAIQQQLARRFDGEPGVVVAGSWTSHRGEDSPYDTIWHRALRYERTAIAELMKAANLYSVSLKRVQADATHGAIYSFDAPFIRENWPPIDLADPCMLIQLDPMALRPELAVYEGHVHSLRRVAGQIWLRCDGLWQRETTYIFNVIFLPQDRLFLNAHRAVDYLARRLKRSGSRLPSGWLFPRWDHLPTVRVELPSADDIAWVDKELNEEQKEAVVSIVHSKRLMPTLILGPPGALLLLLHEQEVIWTGTGKTKTIVETAQQIIRRHENAHVLICAASGPSADTVALRFSTHLSPQQLLRLNDVSRTFEEVNSRLLPWTYNLDGRFEVPPISEILARRVVVCTCDEAALLLHSHCTNDALGRLAKTVIGSLHPFATGLFGPHWTHLLVDEAAQAHEPQVSIPLAVMAPAVDIHGESPPQICLCGDVKQLGPNIVSEEARSFDLDTSLLERLFRRAVYDGHPDTRKSRLARRTGRTSTTWDDQGGGRDKPFVELVRNYRSHPCILMLPSALFYADSLIACASLPRAQLSPVQWKRLPRSDFPLLFVGTESQDLFVDDGVSWFNEGEQAVVVRLVQDLVRSGAGRVQPREISVITPFREQVWRIRLALRAIGLSEVDVGNVESLQGNENRVVFLSTVRSSSKRIAEDVRSNRGLIMQPRRMNVSLTRARELLVIVGNTVALSTDPDWRAYIAFCRRNGVYEGVEPPVGAIAEDTSHVSYMEEAFHHARIDGKGDEEELTSRILVGAMASAVLRDA